jgi:predicted transcriptional regulator
LLAIQRQAIKTPIRPGSHRLHGKASDSNGKQKVRSAEVGTDILKALAELSPSTSLSRLAEHVQMPASKVHRYLQALIASGFAEQNSATNHYGLGREALRVGLAALNSMDVLKVAALPWPSCATT